MKYTTDERDQFLTEAMGECWHKWDELNKCDNSYDHNVYLYECSKCKKQGEEHEYGYHNMNNNNFSTWEGFGILWNWAQQQEWFEYICRKILYPPILSNYTSVYLKINPEVFANTLYEFLRSRP